MKARREQFKLLLQAALWASVLALLWFALRDVSWPAVLDLLGGLRSAQIAALAGINILIVVLLGARWWLILRSQGFKVPLAAAAAYRLVSFGISYLTPGPHFGGEPAQAYLLYKRHNVPVESAAASIALDKLLELCANFAFLIFGVSVLLAGGLIEFHGSGWVLGASVAAFFLPVLYLGALSAGAAPVGSMAERLSVRGKPLLPEKIRRTARSAEIETGCLLRKQPLALFQAVLLSVLIWVLLVFEYLLLLGYLGLELDFWQVISIITGARLAILLPFPAGLGALEAALILITRAMGEAAAVGAGIGLVIRSRDLFFSLVGLGLGAVWMSTRGALPSEGRSQKFGQGS